MFPVQAQPISCFCCCFVLVSIASIGVCTYPIKTVNYTQALHIVVEKYKAKIQASKGVQTRVFEALPGQVDESRCWGLWGSMFEWNRTQTTIHSSRQFRLASSIIAIAITRNPKTCSTCLWIARGNTQEKKPTNGEKTDREAPDPSWRINSWDLPTVRPQQ